MQKKRKSPPATKKDLRNLDISLRMDMRKEMQNLRTDLRKERHIDMQNFKKEITEAMQVIAENLVYDFRGIFKDRTEQIRDRMGDHENRLQRLESRLLPA